MEKQQLRSRKPRLTAVEIRCADYATPSTRKKLVLTSTSGGRSVGIVRLRTKATEFSFLIVYMRKVESRVQIADRCAPWKFSSGAENLVS
jgi:hypothetical protein